MRQRKLNTKQPLRIFREREIDETPDDESRGNIPHVETGVEKGEEIVSGFITYPCGCCVAIIANLARVRNTISKLSSMPPTRLRWERRPLASRATFPLRRLSRRKVSYTTTFTPKPSQHLQPTSASARQSRIASACRIA